MTRVRCLLPTLPHISAFAPLFISATEYIDALSLNHAREIFCYPSRIRLWVHWVHTCICYLCVRQSPTEFALKHLNNQKRVNRTSKVLPKTARLSDPPEPVSHEMPFHNDLFFLIYVKFLSVKWNLKKGVLAHFWKFFRPAMMLVLQPQFLAPSFPVSISSTLVFLTTVSSLHRSI